MPIYEYRCGDCSHELEALQRISDDPLTDCPECGKPSLRKQISAAGFRLKGSGWYETDFKTNNKRNLAGDDKPKSEGETSKSGETKKSEAKPEKTTTKVDNSPAASAA